MSITNLFVAVISIMIYLADFNFKSFQLTLASFCSPKCPLPHGGYPHRPHPLFALRGLIWSSAGAQQIQKRVWWVGKNCL